MRYLINYIRKGIRIEHVIIIWLAINMISASFTQLYSDEAYYALFADKLAFGYFDHPPMIALMIRIGTFIFKNETGVRLLSVISFCLALYFIYKLSGVNKPILFLAAIFSIFGLNVLGFLALPDSPLLLFSALFFLAYKKYLIKGSLFNSLLLGLTIAAMLYSKYHGILILFFTVISNLKLLRSGKFWLAIVVSFLLFTPHIIWQLNNDLVSISYHFFERSASQYKFSYTYNYLLGQILYYGPVSIIFMIIAAIKYKQSDLFENALTWNLWGFIGFFLLSSFKGSVEVNWTLPIVIPMLIFFLKFTDGKPLFTRWFYRLAIPVIIMISILRVEIASPVFNLKIKRIDDLRGNKEFVKEIINKCHGLPLITDSYQKAGIVSFYAKTFAPSINLNGRRNQFNLWHAEDSLRYKKVAYINNYLDEGEKIQSNKYKDYKVSIIDSLPVMNDILITLEFREQAAKQNEVVNLKVALLAQSTPKDYHDRGDYTTRLCASLYKGKELLNEEVCLLPVDLLLKIDNGEYNFQLRAPSEKGKYQIVVSLKTTGLGTWSTKKSVRLTVI